MIVANLHLEKRRTETDAKS